MNFKSSPFLKNLIILIVLLLVGCATFSNALHQEFIIDDDEIFNNPLIKNPENLKYYFLPSKDKALSINGLREEIDYRPLTRTSYVMLYSLLGDNPRAYHVFNIIIFVLAGFAVYCLSLYILKDVFLSFVTSLYFVIHPINGLLVNYCTAYVFSLQVICSSLAILLFLKAFEKKINVFLYVTSFVFYFAAIFFHETAMVIPLYIAALLLMVRKEHWQAVLLKVSPFLIGLAAYLLFRLRYASLKTGILDNAHQLGMSEVEYWASLAKGIFWYLSQLIYPDGIVLMWETPIVRQHGLVWTAALFVAVIICSFFVTKYKNRLAALAAVWLVIGFLPVTMACLIKTLVGVIMEPHWMVFASIGFFMLLALWIKRCHAVNPLLGKIVFIMLVVAMSVVSKGYNYLWADEVRYCQYWLTQAPDLKSIEFYLGNAYLKRGELGLAKKHFYRSLDNNFSDYQAYANLGIIDHQNRHFDEAVTNYKVGLAINPASAEIYNNLGVTYKQLGRFEDAEASFNQALQANRFFVEPRINLANLAVRDGDLEKAFRLYEENLKINPYEERSTYQLVALSFDLKSDNIKLPQIIEGFIRYNKNYALLTNLGSLLAKNNQIDLARKAYQAALKVNPAYKEAYIEFGKLLGNLERYDAAAEIWRKGMALDSNDKRFQELIDRVNVLKSEAQ